MGLIKRDDRGVSTKDGNKPNTQDAEADVMAAESVPPADAAAQKGAADQPRAPAGQEGRSKTAPDFAFLERDPPDEIGTSVAEANAASDTEEMPKGVAASEEATPQPARIHPGEWPTFAVHLRTEPTLIRLSAPAPDIVDPEPERARIERELGVPALVSSVAKYGTPPVAPPATKTNRAELEHRLRAEAGNDVSRFRLGARRTRRHEMHERAVKQADADDERLAEEQEQLQHDLDDKWAELRELRHRAAQAAEAWVKQETLRREEARDEQQAVVDEQWGRMREADADSVTEALRAAFPNATTTTPDGTTAVKDGAATVLGFFEGAAVSAVVCRDRDELISDTEPPAGGARRRARRRRSEEHRNDLYLAAVGSRVLAAVGRCLSSTPAVDEVICIAVRTGKAGHGPWEPIYVGSFERAYADRLLAEGRWSTDPSLLKQAVEGAEDVELELTDGSREINALDASDDPGLEAVMEQMDAAITSSAVPRGPAQEAVRLFLMGTDAEDDVKNKKGEEALAHLSGDTQTTHERRGSTASASPVGATTARQDHPNAAQAHSEPPPPAEEAPPSSEQLATSERDGDPLPHALKDPDASVRRAAVEAIGRRNDSADTPLLLGALSDADEIVRLEAMYAMRDRLSPDLRRDALIKSCGDSDGTVRRKAIEALADLGDERDTPVLLGALKDTDDGVRLEAIYAVKHRLRPEMREELIGACADANEGVRRKAIEALAGLGDERDTPLLLKALKDPDSSVRLEAIYALEGRSSLGSSSRLNEPLLEAMQAEDATVRQAAVRLFGRL
jgi:hypothetical protein